MRRRVLARRFQILILLFITIAGVLPMAGATFQQDGTQKANVTYFSHQKIDAISAKGPTLYPRDGGDFSVLMAQRNKAGEVEVHTRDTDIIYVVSGSATFVTGGKTVNSKATAADEIRGTAIKGGQTRHISCGDVIVVPHGVPHWFKEVSGQVRYFVVKVR